MNVPKKSSPSKRNKAPARKIKLKCRLHRQTRGRFLDSEGDMAIEFKTCPWREGFYLAFLVWLLMERRGFNWHCAFGCSKMY